MRTRQDLLDRNNNSKHLQQFPTIWEKLCARCHPGSSRASRITFCGSSPTMDTTPLSLLIWRNSLDSLAQAFRLRFGRLGLPPNANFFAWLVNQNRIWITDRLQRREWPNCGRCPLCNQVQESAAHLLFKCRFSIRVWNEVFSWLGLIIPMALWHRFGTIKSWWDELLTNNTQPVKAISALLLLVGWELWKERNARVFRSKARKWRSSRGTSKKKCLFGPLRMPSI